MSWNCTLALWGNIHVVAILSLCLVTKWESPQEAGCASLSPYCCCSWIMVQWPGWILQVRSSRGLEKSKEDSLITFHRTVSLDMRMWDNLNFQLLLLFCLSGPSREILDFSYLSPQYFVTAIVLCLKFEARSYSTPAGLKLTLQSKLGSYLQSSSYHSLLSY